MTRRENLLFGSKDQIIKTIQYEIDTLGKKGGFVLSPAHNIQPDTSPENIIKLFHHAKQYQKSVI